MIRLGVKNCNMILIAKQPKYRVYHQVKFTNEYLTGEDILPSNQQQIIEQAKSTYSPLGKAFEKQVKTIEGQGQKQVDALKIWNQKNKQIQLRINIIISQTLQLYLMIFLAKEKNNERITWQCWL